MKSLYWKTRSLRRTASGARRAHWPGVVLNLVLAFVLVAHALGALVLAGLEGSFAEVFGLADALLPIIVTWALALAAVGLGYQLTVPGDRLPGEAGEPPAQRITRWFHWANLRAVLFGGLAAATVLAAAHTLSGWQGRRAWEAYRAEAEKRGVVFDLEKLMPPPVPDAENFAATPLLRSFQSGNPEFTERRTKLGPQAPESPFRPDDPHMKSSWPNRQNWIRGERWNFPELQGYYRSSTNFPAWPTPRTPSEDVLKALSRFDSELAELHGAAARPQTRFNIQLSEDGVSTLIPHLAVMKSLQWTVTLRSVARLEAGRTNDAFADAKLAFRLSDTVRGDALLIGHLVRLATHNLALRTLWEGLADHRWTDTQLAHWQADLAKRNFGAELRHAMAGERAYSNRAMEFIRRRPEMLGAMGDLGNGEPLKSASGFGKFMSRLPPPGWMCMEQINLNRAFEEFIIGALPTGNERFDPALIRSKDAAMEDYFARNRPGIKGTLRHCVMSVMFLPAVSKASHKACQAQTFTHLAAAACVLERHRLARGSYPETLAALAPEFGPLPPDPMSGQPFRYERTADGRFRLWSVGWNGKDDGGTVALTGTPASKSRNINFEQGDWVWPVPVQ
ncbi:MAG: Uncharacterized protein FD161_2502 [Limisphaerales bacterium]|nr:MAG: Uncharacterized protein FD161_2502 [Limisphaerales bacterium]KAG0508622.1 MAG: Uncharacterized protein E1N63_2253 [Limisphaerales bacterium]TXT48063.1 MAG: Uncharacterized protein FD140_3813 [Limisphaerales bacterium]